MRDVPASTAESDAMSKALQAYGFTFVGSTICYSFMQATGMVNDHITTCFRYKPISKMGNTRRRTKDGGRGTPHLRGQSFRSRTDVTS
jgi:hypothetical protein